MNEELPVEAEPTRVPPAATRSLWNIFTRRWWIIAQATAALFFGGLIIGFLQPKVYRATALLLISRMERGSRGAMPTPEEAWSRVESEVPVHIRLIRSASIAEKVRNNLKLTLSLHELLSNISCDQLKGTREVQLLALHYEDVDPARAQRVVNEWARVYVEESQNRSTRSIAAALDYVEKQISSVEEELHSLEDQVARAQAQQYETGISSEALQRIAQLRSSLATNRARQEAVQAQIKEIEALLEQEPKQIEETEEEPSPLVKALEQELASLHLKRQQMLESYFEDSPEVKAIDEQIARIERQLEKAPEMTRTVVRKSPNPTRQKLQDLLADLRGELTSLRAQERALQRQFDREIAKVKRFPDTQTYITRLQQRQKVLSDIHSMLLSRLYELQMKKAMAVSPVQLVETAEMPRRPVRPNVGLLGFVGLVFGFLIGVTLAVLMDQIEDTFASVDEIEAVTGLRVIGAIPRFDAELEETSVPVVDEPRSSFANSVRMVASLLRMELERHRVRQVIITSAGREEGKTTLVANLAAAFAGGGEKVIAVDGDLHNPQLHRFLKVENRKGLSNLLLGEGKVEDFLQETEVEGLRVLPSGPIPPSPTDFLMGDQLADVVRQLGETADLVIWDTPPGAVLPDALIMAERVGAALIVVGRSGKRRGVVQVATNLEGTGAKVIGVVANQVRPAGGYYYYYYYYYPYAPPEEEAEDGAEA